MKNRIDETSAPGEYAYPAIAADEKVGTSMQRSAGDQIQQEMEASEKASETQQDAAYACVDQYTLGIIQQIFPMPNKGLEFTANILRYAQVVQNMLPGLEDLGQHVAVINVRTIRLLAKLIEWGYDTTHKYVTTFCALGLLRKVKQGADRLLVFPLERYVLPLNLQPLDSLIAKSRPKVQQFARQVKVRLEQLNPAALPQSESKEVGAFEGNKVYSTHTLYQSLFGIIESEGIDPSTSWHLSKRIITEVLSKLQAPALALEASGQSYEQAATGTFDGKGTNSSTPQLEVSSRSQARSDEYRVEPSKYQTESTERRQKSTNTQTEYPQTHAGSTDHRHEYTNQQTKYPHNAVESTLPSVQGRLSDAKVSDQGRLTEAETTSASREEKTPAGRNVPAKVSSYSSAGDVQGDQKKVKQAPSYTIEEMYEHMMTKWDILTSYEYILRENLIDWEADGLPTQFIELLYEEISTVNADYKKKGSIVASRGFFLNLLEKRTIQKLAYEYQLDFIDVYNLILFRTNREHLMIADSQVHRQPAPPAEGPQASAQYSHSSHPQEYQAPYSHNDYQPEYQEVRSTQSARTNEYQYPAEVNQHRPSVDSSVNEYRPHEDHYADEYQYPTHSQTNEQYSVDQYADEYQGGVDSRTNQYQPRVDQYANEYQPSVDPMQSESSRQQSPVDFQRQQQSRQVDPSAQESTWVAQERASAEEPYAPESTPQVPIAELIDQAALQDGLSRLRIPSALSKQNYTSDFLNVYVTYNIYNLFKKIYSDVTLRNDGKMFFAEIFDTARASAAKNWYNRLFTKCTSPENLLAAFVETIIDLHSRGNVTIQNPGGLFNKKVAECEKVIGDRTLENARVYGELCYEDFVLQIARLASRESLGIN
jgi:hypothetical protein